jgi:hypothetical protein
MDARLLARPEDYQVRTQPFAMPTAPSPPMEDPTAYQVQPGPVAIWMRARRLASANDCSRLPMAWPFSGKSIPLSLIRSGCWLCRTSMVSPSRTETTGPEKSATTREGLNRNRRKQRARTCVLPRPTNGGEAKRRPSDEIELSGQRECIAPQFLGITL